MFIDYRNGELHLLTENEEGISVQELYNLLGKMMEYDPNAKNTPVALCLQEIDTFTTLITAACNEGDNSVLWLSVSPETEAIIQRGFNDLALFFQTGQRPCNIKYALQDKDGTFFARHGEGHCYTPNLDEAELWDDPSILELWKGKDQNIVKVELTRTIKEDTVWELVEQAGDYWFWKVTVKGKSAYNCTSTPKPPSNDAGGYFNLDYLKQLKNVKPLAGARPLS